MGGGDSPLSLKADFLLSLCELVVGGRDGLQPIEKTVIDRCVRQVYREMGDTGMTMHGIKVTRQSRRKRKIIMITSTKASYTVLSTSAMEARIDVYKRQAWDIVY